MSSTCENLVELAYFISFASHSSEDRRNSRDTPIDTAYRHSYRHGLSTQPIATAFRHSLSPRPIYTAYRHGLSTQPIATAYRHSLSTRPIDTVYRHSLSTRPTDTKTPLGHYRATGHATGHRSQSAVSNKRDAPPYVHTRPPSPHR